MQLEKPQLRRSHFNDPVLTPAFFEDCGQPEIAAEWRRQLREVT